MSQGAGLAVLARPCSKAEIKVCATRWRGFGPALKDRYISCIRLKRETMADDLIDLGYRMLVSHSHITREAVTNAVSTCVIHRHSFTHLQIDTDPRKFVASSAVDEFRILGSGVAY